MLTGRGAFSGETTSDILAAVIRAEPDWSAVPDSVLQGIRELLRRCLQKDPRQRLRDIGDARIAIEEAASGPGGPGREGTAAASEAATTGARRGTAWRFLAVGVVIGAILAGGVSRYLRPAATPRAISRFAFSFPSPGEQPTATGGFPCETFRRW
jgi:serine/threonine-protein kinase